MGLAERVLERAVPLPFAWGGGFELVMLGDEGKEFKSGAIVSESE